MAQPFIGQIILFAGTWAPPGWAFCFGQMMLIQQNETLYAVLGTTYGGDGKVTFNLPDFRGRAPIGTGVITDGSSAIPQNGSNNIPSGQQGGSSKVSLTQANLPAHSHPLAVSAAAGSATSPNPTGNFLANTTPLPDSGGNLITDAVSLYSTTSNAIASPQAIGSTGDSQPVVFETPYIAMNYIIALTGVFPPHP